MDSSWKGYQNRRQDAGRKADAVFYHEVIAKSTRERKQVPSLLGYFYKDVLGNLKDSKELKHDAVRERTTARRKSV